jgi:carboxypeptidase Taq
MKCAYSQLEEKNREIGMLKSIESLAQWDHSVNMPLGGGSLREQQMMYLSALIHKKQTAPALEDLIAQAEPKDDWQRANLNLIKKNFILNSAFDSKFVEAFTQSCLSCELSWRAAKEENNFSLFASKFKQVMELTKEKAQITGQLLNLSSYDALLDSYDSGRKSAEIDEIFSKLEQQLPKLIASLSEQKNTKTINIELGEAIERKIGLHYIQKIGFDMNRGRLDTSSHPFSIALSCDDVRITTRYTKEKPFSSFYAILHEAGHGIYEQNLPREFAFQPVGSACGLAIHESQSLFVERHIGLNKAFIRAVHTELKQNLAIEFDSNDLYDYLHSIDDSLVRVDADEVTYPAHIILRYKLEKALLSGDLPIDEIPAAWDELSLKLLGRKPVNLKQGALQDIHWSWGAMGYFPTYALGAMFAAQIANYLEKQYNIEELFLKEQFTEVITWLKTNIHNRASVGDSNQLILSSVKDKINPEVYLDYLTQKYYRD